MQKMEPSVNSSSSSRIMFDLQIFFFAENSKDWQNGSSLQRLAQFCRVEKYVSFSRQILLTEPKKDASNSPRLYPAGHFLISINNVIYHRWLFMIYTQDECSLNCTLKEQFSCVLVLGNLPSVLLPTIMLGSKPFG